MALHASFHRDVDRLVVVRPRDVAEVGGYAQVAPKAASGTAVPKEWTTRMPLLMANFEEARGPELAPRDMPMARDAAHERDRKAPTTQGGICMLGWVVRE